MNMSWVLHICLTMLQMGWLDGLRPFSLSLIGFLVSSLCWNLPRLLLKTAQDRTTSMMALTRLLRAHFPVFARRPPSSSQWGVSGRRLQTRGAGPLHSGGSSKGHRRLWVPHPFQAILRSGHQDRHVNCTWLKCQKPGLLFNIGTKRFTYGGARTVELAHFYVWSPKKDTYPVSNPLLPPTHPIQPQS